MKLLAIQTYHNNMFSMIFPQPACLRPDLPQRADSLRRDLERLGKRFRTEGQNELDNFEEKINASGNRDGTLTEQARNATEMVKE